MAFTFFSRWRNAGALPVRHAHAPLRGRPAKCGFRMISQQPEPLP